MNVHRFKMTGEAYNASQTHDDIRDGDILIATREGVVGIMVSAWPTAVGPGFDGTTGEFHLLADDKTWATFDDGQYAAAAERAVEIRRIIRGEISGGGRGRTVIYVRDREET